MCALRQLALHHIPGHSPVQYMAFQYIFTPKGAVFYFIFFHIKVACLPPGNKVGTLFSKEAAQQVKQEWLQAQKEQSADSNKPVKMENTAPRDMAVRARTASRALQNLSSKQRAQLLHKIAENLLAKEDEIMQENDKDCQVGCLGQQLPVCVADQCTWLGCMQSSAGNIGVGTMSVVCVATCCMWLGYMQISAGKFGIVGMLSSG